MPQLGAAVCRNCYWFGWVEPGGGDGGEIVVTASSAGAVQCDQLPRLITANQPLPRPAARSKADCYDSAHTSPRNTTDWQYRAPLNQSREKPKNSQ